MWWNKEDKLVKKSEKIHSLFTKTKDKCTDVNQEIDNLVAKKKEEAAKLQAQIDNLNGVATKNSNLSNKIETFLTT